jgi:hypothetical protein
VRLDNLIELQPQKPVYHWVNVKPILNIGGSISKQILCPIIRVQMLGHIVWTTIHQSKQPETTGSNDMKKNSNSRPISPERTRWIHDRMLEGKDVTIFPGVVTRYVAHDPWERDEIIENERKTNAPQLGLN